MSWPNPPKHGHRGGTGKDRSPTYISWMKMRSRCNNQNDKSWHMYGGIGIKCCDRWASFENFLADMGPRPPRHDLSRRDEDDDYRPGNCDWLPAQKNRHPNATRRWKSQVFEPKREVNPDECPF